MANGIDPLVFRDLSYGLYIVTTRAGERQNGQIVNTVMQVTAEPPKVAVVLNQKNLTHELILQSGVFAACILDETTTMKFIGPFGFRSGRDVDKFAAVGYKAGTTGCPLVTEHALSALEAKVVEKLDLGSHTIFIADVVSAEVINSGNPLTYRFYHENLKGKTPPGAPSYRPPTA
jgi:ferric-chelate reductase [NAD(P)H]